MERLRHQAPESFAGQKVVTVKDYMHLTEMDVESGRVNSIDFPAANVLQFITEGGYMISARPSGTEPKIKFYISVNGELSDKSQFLKRSAELDEVINQIKSELDF
jgi:phosphoglucomutase